MNSAEGWELVVDGQVDRQLRRVPVKHAEQILAAIGAMVASPYAGDVAKMQGEDNVWRRRVGAYRIFFEILPREKLIHVFRVERRTSTTY